MAIGQEGFQPVESRVLATRANISPVVGQSHFIDSADQLWFVNEVEISGGQLDVSITRYDFARGLGYDIPAARTSRFGPPTDWTVVDAAGVPVKLVRIDFVSQPTATAQVARSGITTFTWSPAVGDTGWGSYGSVVVNSTTNYTYLFKTYAFPAVHHRRGGRQKDGYMLPATLSLNPVSGSARGILAINTWGFAFTDGDPYTSKPYIASPRITFTGYPPVYPSNVNLDGLATYDDIFVGDFIEVKSA